MMAIRQGDTVTISNDLVAAMTGLSHGYEVKMLGMPKITFHVDVPELESDLAIQLVRSLLRKENVRLENQGVKFNRF